MLPAHKRDTKPKEIGYTANNFFMIHPFVRYKKIVCVIVVVVLVVIICYLLLNLLVKVPCRQDLGRKSNCSSLASFRLIY